MSGAVGRPHPFEAWGSPAEPFLQATLDALSYPVALLDGAGRIVEVSESWRELCQRGSGVVGAIGENYLDRCQSHFRMISGARVLRAGVIRVLNSEGRLTFERVCRQRKHFERRDFRVGIKRLRDCEPPRYLLAHEDVTEVVQSREFAERAGERLREVQTEERERLAEQLHNSVGQNLVAMGLSLAMLQTMTPRAGKMTALIDDLSRALDGAYAEIRTVSYLLHPPWPEEVGAFELAVREFTEGFARRAGLRADIRLDDYSEVDRSLEWVLFRAVQEALVNVHRHAHAKTVLVELSNRESDVKLCVRDDGVGFSAADGQLARSGVGLRDIRARVARLGGEVRINTGPRGSTLIVRLPKVDPPLGTEGARGRALNDRHGARNRTSGTICQLN